MYKLSQKRNKTQTRETVRVQKSFTLVIYGTEVARVFLITYLFPLSNKSGTFETAYEFTAAAIYSTLQVLQAL